MTMAEVKIKQWGNSLGLIIPNEIVKLEELNTGDVIKIEIQKRGKIDGFGILKGKPFFKEEKERDDFW